MNRPTVSVIIPVYNVEKYLERCVKSVVTQTISNYEIILIDDGSLDSSGEICDVLSQKYSCIKVIHKNNGGLASARNAGLDVANGDYIFFLDSDDWIDQDALERLLNMAQTHNVDFVRYTPVYAGWPNHNDGEPYIEDKIRMIESGYYDRKRIEKEILPRCLATPKLTMGAIVSAWRSLYNHDFLIKNSLSFNSEIRYCEDSIFSARVTLASSSFFYMETPGIYHYYYNPSSITKSFKSDRLDSTMKLLDAVNKYFGQITDYNFQNQLSYFSLFCILSLLSQKRCLDTYHQRKEYCKKICQVDFVRNTIRKMNNLDISYKLKIYLYCIRLKLYHLVTII